MEKGKIESRLNEVSRLLHSYSQEKELVEQTLKSLDEHRAEMKKYKTLLMIEERLMELIRVF